MNHRHFETWLLEDKRLTPEENKALQSHLRTCAKCAALAEANLALHTVVMAAPAPGFASRFRVRLEARRKSQRRRYLYGGIILLLGGLSLILWLAWPVLPLVFRSPTQLITAWASALVSLISSLQVIGGIGSVLLRVAAGFIPNYAWGLTMLFFGGLSLIWVSSIQKFTRISQGI